MLISVVIPTRNRNDLLARCLKCLAPGVQTLDSVEYEVIVTDDGSSSTADSMICEQFPWARWTQGPRRGPAGNRNHGVSVARGEWIAFTDDDCVPAAGWLNALRSAVEEEIELYEGRTTCEAGLQRFVQDAPINLEGGTFPSCNLMLSRRLFDEVGGFDADFPPHAIMEDIDFRQRVVADDRKWRFVRDAVIDHPPRPRVTGLAAGARWENRVYYELKWARRKEVRFWLPQFVFKVRLAQMVKEHRISDYPPALWSLGGELLHVITHVSRWQRTLSATIARRKA